MPVLPVPTEDSHAGPSGWSPSRSRLSQDSQDNTRAVTSGSLRSNGSRSSRASTAKWSLANTPLETVSLAATLSWAAPDAKAAETLYEEDDRAVQNVAYADLGKAYPMLCFCEPGGPHKCCRFNPDGHRGRLPRRRKLLWAWPFFSWTALKAIKLAFMKKFYTDEKDASLGIIAFVTVLSVLIDAFTDPAMGRLTDNLRSKYGRRRPFIFLSAFLTPAVFLLAWMPPATGLTASLWYAAFHILYKLAETLFIITNSAWGASLTPNYSEKTNVWAWRDFMSVGGILFGAATFGVLYDFGFGYAYLVVVVFSILYCQGALSLAYFGKEAAPEFYQGRRSKDKSEDAAETFSDDDVIPVLISTALNRPFRILLVTAITKAFGQDVPFNILPFMVQWVLGEKCPVLGTNILFSLLIVGNTLSQMASIVPWQWLGSKTNKWIALMAYHCTSAITALLFVFLRRDTGDCSMTILCVVFTCLWGFSYGGGFFLADLVSDVVDYDQFLAGGRRREANYLMAVEFIPKFANIPGESIPFLLLAYLGYARPLHPQPPSCAGSSGRSDSFCNAFYMNASRNGLCSDEWTCADYVADGVQFVCSDSAQECGIAQNEGVRWMLTLCFSVAPFVFVILAGAVLCMYPKHARTEEAHKRLLQATSELKRGRTVEDPWRPGSFVSPATEVDGPNAGALSYFFPSELKVAIERGREDEGAGARSLLKRPLLASLFSSPLLAIGIAVVAWGFEGLFTDLGASVAPLGLMAFGLGLLCLWFEGTRALVALKLRYKEVKQTELVNAYNKLCPFIGEPLLHEDGTPMPQALGVPSVALSPVFEGSLEREPTATAAA